MSRLALEQLEARCDQLQRRIGDKQHSPSRKPGGSLSPTRGRLTTTASFAGAASTNRASSLAGGSSGSSGGASLPSHEMAWALQKLERDKARLEEELRLVNLNIAAFRQLMQLPLAAPKPPSSTEERLLTASSATVALGGAPAKAAPIPRERATQVLSSALTSPARARSPPALAAAARLEPTARSTPAAAASVVPASLPNDQIAEELRRIRRAREEREAQRRLSAALAGAGSPAAF